MAKPDSSAEVDQKFQLWHDRVEQCKDRRVLWETQVATNMHFAYGSRKIWWDDKGMMRERVMNDNEVFRPINLFPSALSVITSRLTENDPRWNPHPSELENVTDAEVDAANAALQNVWEGDENGDGSIKRELKLVIRDSYLMGGRLVYFRFDEDSDMPVMDSFSLMDVFSDAPQTLKEKQWLAIAVPKDNDWIKKNPLFDAKVRALVSIDNKLAESGLQQQYLYRQMGGRSTTVNSNTSMLYYCFEVRSKKGGKKKSKDDVQDINENVQTSSQNAIYFCVVSSAGVLQELELPYDRLSAIFDIFKPIEDGVFYGRPPCSDWIEPSKSIDTINSNIESYISNFLQGKWILRDRNVSVPVAGRQGQKIVDPTGNSVTQLPMQPLPQTHFLHGQNQERHFERLSGVHSESIGRLSGGADSGVAIAQLQATDQQNSSDTVDNFRMFLKRCGKKILRQMSDHWSDVKVLYRYDKMNQEYHPMKVVGEKFYDEADASMEGVTLLRPFKSLDVDLEIGALYKEGAKRDQIVALLNTGWQPGMNPLLDQVILSGFNIGVGRDLVRMIKEKQNPYSWIGEGNIQLILQGQDVAVSPGDPHSYFSGLYRSKAEELLKAGDQRGATLLNAQASRHAVFEQQGMNAGTGEAPETAEEASALGIGNPDLAMQAMEQQAPPPGAPPQQ